LRQFLLQALLLLEENRDGLFHGSRLGPQLARHLAQLLELAVDERERRAAGGRFDAADSRGDAALGIDLEEPDVPGARDVRAAAELARAADVEHAHLVAVFLA